MKNDLRIIKNALAWLIQNCLRSVSLSSIDFEGGQEIFKQLKESVNHIEIVQTGKMYAIAGEDLEDETLIKIDEFGKVVEWDVWGNFDLLIGKTIGDCKKDEKCKIVLRGTIQSNRK